MRRAHRRPSFWSRSAVAIVAIGVIADIAAIEEILLRESTVNAISILYYPGPTRDPLTAARRTLLRGKLGADRLPPRPGGPSCAR
eukprot:5981441-Heterocapsa_arctica.AAC.1